MSWVPSRTHGTGIFFKRGKDWLVILNKYEYFESLLWFRKKKFWIPPQKNPTQILTVPGIFKDENSFLILLLIGTLPRKENCYVPSLISNKKTQKILMDLYQFYPGSDHCFDEQIFSWMKEFHGHLLLTHDILGFCTCGLTRGSPWWAGSRQQEYWLPSLRSSVGERARR